MIVGQRPPPQGDAVASARHEARRRTTVLVVLFVASFTLALPLYLRGLVPLDEGALVHVAERLAKGELLYRDVATGLAPAAYYLLALLYRVFGPSLEIGRLLQAAVLATSACLVLVLASRFAPRRTAHTAALVFVSIELFAYRYPNYSPPAVLLILAALILFLEHLEPDGGYETALASGLALGLSLLFKQNYAALVALALGAILLRRALVDRRRATARATAVFTAGLLAPVLLVLLALSLVGSLGPFLDYGVFALVSETLPSFYKPYPLLDPRDPLFFRRDLLNYLPFPPLVEVLDALEVPRRHWLLSASIVSVFLAAPALLLGAVALLVRDLRLRRLDEAALALVAAAAALFAGVFPRSDYHHLVLVLPLALVTAAWLWGRLAPALPRAARRTGGVLVALFALVSVASPFLPILLPLPERLDTPLATPRARSIVVAASEAARVRTLLGWLASHTGPEDPILVLPDDPIVYFLARRTNPSPYPLVLPGSFDEDRLLESLARVEVVVARDAAYDSTPLASLFPRLVDRLRSEFVPEPEYLQRLSRPSSEPLQVLVRRASPGSQAATTSGPDLTRTLGGARASILTFDGRELPPRGDEIPRFSARSWLGAPSLFLRPPSGWQKLVVELPVWLAGEARLELSLALRPTRRADADGAWLETFLYRPGEDRVEHLGTRWAKPTEPGSWLGVPLAYTLRAAVPGPALVVFAVSSGPHLEEEGDEVIVMQPRLVPPVAGTTALSAGHPLELPGTARRQVAAFDDAGLFERALASAPDDALILGHLGTVYARQGLLDEARRTLDSAVRLAPANPELRLALAELLLSSGDRDGALAAYETLLTLAPDHPRALAKSAELLAEDPSQVELALRRARRAVRRHPEEGSAHLALGWVHLARGGPHLASEQFLAALGLVADRQPVLEALNRYAPWGALDGPQGPLTRAAGPLPEAAFRARIETVSLLPPVLAAGTTLVLTVRLVNPTDIAWPALGEPDGRYRVALTYRLRALESDSTSDRGGVLLLGADLGPGSSRFLDLHLTAPARPGPYELVVDAVQEGVGRFAERGGDPLSLRLTVQ